MIEADHLPARSWYDLAHQQTRCTYLEHREDWQAIIDIVDAAHPELTRRQFKALDTSLLCAKARALSRLGQHAEADRTLGTAVRTCPRGAVDPLIALEASHALCSSLRGDTAGGSVHYDRALAACRAIGHRYHEWWIERDRAAVARIARGAAPAAQRELAVSDAALILGDVAAALGAGHSIDLLAHRIAGLLRGTTIGSRVEVHSESELPHDPTPSASWEGSADGSFSIRLRGSDRLVQIRIKGLESIDEVSLLKSLADIVQAAVHRTADTEAEDEDQTLWPRTTVQSDDDPIFQSPRMVELLKIAMRLASTELPVLITGETGTGKEVIAKLLHEHSHVKRGPFQPFNCSTVPRDLVESQLFGHRRGAFTGAAETFPGMIKAAEGGTLFLDEIGDLDLAVQPKLLRFLESGEIQPIGDVRPHRVAVRVVAATNADLERRVADGRFRSDLFYRIDAARLTLPPLRERKDEIPALAALFFVRAVRECGRSNLRLADDLIAALILYDWPGNIRQLANEVRRIVAMATDGQALGSADLSPEITRNWKLQPASPRSGGPEIQLRLDQTLAQAVDELEQKFIEHALEVTGGRVSDAARLLGLSRKGLFLKRQRRGMIKP